jgi:hypothetical protein
MPKSTFLAYGIVAFFQIGIESGALIRPNLGLIHPFADSLRPSE